MAASWRTAYFKQALADYELFLMLENAEDVPLCHRLHYLQMMTEKMAKGFKTEEGGGEYAHTHVTFVPFLKIAKSRPEIMQACGIRTKEQFHAYLNGLYDLAAAVQDLAPAQANRADIGVNPEYPWETPKGIVAPVDFDFPGIDLNAKNAKLNKLMTFIKHCFEIAEREMGQAWKSVFLPRIL